MVAKKYQFNDLVNRKFFSLLGILAIAMTSLNEIIWMPVIRAII